MKMIFQELVSPAESSFIVKEYLQPKFTAPFHFHHGFEFALIVKSYGKIYAGNRVNNFNSGELYFFGPGFPHCFYNEKSFIESGETAHAIAVKFKEDFLGKDFFEKPELRKVRKLLDISYSGVKIPTSNNELIPLFIQLTQLKGLNTLRTLLEILDIASSEKNTIITSDLHAPKFSENDSAKLEAVLKYVFENFKGMINSKEAASLACLNEAAFCRYFKRRTKKTFSQFVSEVRITHATSLLLEETMNVNMICFECGFENISYFNRQFKSIMNKTPMQYRDEFLQAHNS